MWPCETRAAWHAAPGFPRSFIASARLAVLPHTGQTVAYWFWEAIEKGIDFSRTGAASGLLPCGGPLAGLSGVLHGVWLKTPAYLVLSRRESAVWENLQLPPIGRYHWLLGCSASRGAVAAWAES